VPQGGKADDHILTGKLHRPQCAPAWSAALFNIISVVAIGYGRNSFEPTISRSQFLCNRADVFADIGIQ
jgi:hypothetical protein